MKKKLINESIGIVNSSDTTTDLETEQKVYDLLLSTRKLFYKEQDRVEFHQFWQQKQAINKDYKDAIKLLKGTKQFIQEDKKDKENNKSMFILPNMNKVIIMDFYTILRTQYLKRYKGWVEYSEQEIK
jgi:hypothetical protein